ncbi:MAG: cell envelope integrity protein CreD [Duncaniella sp.]|nr:cell envelope integrity protein CreD [Duncaniella sp.]
MENHQLPPPVPVITPHMSYGTKIINIALICLVLMCGAFAIWALSDEREQSAVNVGYSIASSWGGKAMITGPFIVSNPDTLGSVTPQIFDLNANIKTQTLHRDIYDLEVYDASVRMTASFDRKTIKEQLGDSVTIKVSIGSGRITGLHPVMIGGKEVKWKRIPNGLVTTVNITDMPESIEFATVLDLRGSESLTVKQIGDQSTILFDGDAANPSFSESCSPTVRNVRMETFSARWDRLSGEEHCYDEATDYVGATFLSGVDRYQKVNRAIKYAFIIIILTFACALFIEIICKKQIPLLNYFLIGTALILFYSLLLALCEHIGFGWAYLVAAAMTIMLITCYLWRMLGSAKASLTMFATLSVIYASCYVMLCASDFALLLGSGLLFAALAAMMYGSLKIKQ